MTASTKPLNQMNAKHVNIKLTIQMDQSNAIWWKHANQFHGYATECIQPIYLSIYLTISLLAGIGKKVNYHHFMHAMALDWLMMNCPKITYAPHFMCRNCGLFTIKILNDFMKWREHFLDRHFAIDKHFRRFTMNAIRTKLPLSKRITTDGRARSFNWVRELCEWKIK